MPAIALLDADVMVNAAIRDTLLRAAEQDLYRLALSHRILDEMRNALEENLGRSRHQTDYLVNEILRSFGDTIVEGYEGLIPSMHNHPDDRHVLATAVRAGAETIVTFNIKHFPPAACKPHGIGPEHQMSSSCTYGKLMKW